MSELDRWRLVSSALIFGLLVALSLMLSSYRRGDTERAQRWELRGIVLGLTSTTGWLLADLWRHSWFSVGMDVLVGLIYLWLLRRWWRRRKPKLSEWLGYKAEAIRARLVRLAAGGVS